MSDRLYVYKTPLHRILETAIVLIFAFAMAAAWQEAIPDISASYVIVAALLLGFVLVPRFGSALAERRGAPMMTRDERSRRYLSEFGPIGTPSRAGSYATLSGSGGQRRSGGRSLRR
ncbi:MAG: hypothetical protein WDN69_25795 [Aliidongia sp.]